MYTVHLTPKSANVKTGPIPVSTTSATTCPNACAFKGNGCYAESGPLALHWRKVTNGERGTNWGEFCKAIAALPDGQFWRHNQSGDLPGDGEHIDAGALIDLVHSNDGKRGFTYTHYSMEHSINRESVKYSNAHGFTINLSANNLDHADQLAALGIAPVVVVLPIDQKENLETPQGLKVVVCPATVRDDVSCDTCQLCQCQRSTIVGFPAHGTGKKKAAKVINIVAA